MLLGLHGLYDYSHVHDQIFGSPIVSNFSSTCSTLLRVPGKHTIDILALISRAKGIISVTIMTNLTTKLTDVIPYMVVLLNLLRLPKLLLRNLLPWTILH